MVGRCRVVLMMVGLVALAGWPTGEGTVSFEDDGAVRAALGRASHVLSSVPPGEGGDPVLARYGDALGHGRIEHRLSARHRAPCSPIPRPPSPRAQKARGDRSSATADRSRSAVVRVRGPPAKTRMATAWTSGVTSACTF